jgi:hypothetical protein
LSICSANAGCKPAVLPKAQVILRNTCASGRTLNVKRLLTFELHFKQKEVAQLFLREILIDGTDHFVIPCSLFVIKEDQVEE